MLGAAVAGVAAPKADPAISWWLELIIVVVGALIASAAGAVVAKWWKWRHRPGLVLSCGDGQRFDKEINPNHAEVTAHTHPGKPLPSAVFMKIVRVQETRGYQAKNVSVRIVDVQPPPDEQVEFPVVAHWHETGNSTVTDSANIGPRGHRDLIFQMILVWGPPWDFFLVTPFGHQQPREATYEIHVDGEHHITEKVIIENGWPVPELAKPDPAHDFTDFGQFPFPTIKKA